MTIDLKNPKASIGCMLGNSAINYLIAERGSAFVKLTKGEINACYNIIENFFNKRALDDIEYGRSMWPDSRMARWFVEYIISFYFDAFYLENGSIKWVYVNWVLMSKEAENGDYSIQHAQKHLERLFYWLEERNYLEEDFV